ncbi:MAG: hypothetical protein RIQ88_153 [Actinomycetota bacterium]|jgi:protein-disulfide isomerase
MIKKILAAVLLINVLQLPQAEAALPPAQVFIVSGSEINMVSRESKVPVSVQNNYDRAVRVRVHAISNNPGVNVQEYVSLNIPARSRKDALIPITVISSGDFKVKVWVTTFTDIRLGSSTYLKVKANPDIEFVILVGFGILVVSLLALGSVRMLRRNRAKV